jgi:hypothetical protein
LVDFVGHGFFWKLTGKKGHLGADTLGAVGLGGGNLGSDYAPAGITADAGRP